MHIEPGVVNGAKLTLGILTAVGSVGIGLKMAIETIKENGFVAFVGRCVITTLLVFCFFEVLPHYPVGVSEVHFILGSTLFLIFGAGPAAVGLGLGLLAQGVFFAPADLPQYGMNATSLIAPLLAVSLLAKKIIPASTAYKDVSYTQALALSTAYQGGVVVWVAFWAFYGNGFSMESLTSVGTFGAAYMTVVIVEPVIDLAVLAAAKTMHQFKDNKLFNARLYQAQI